MALYRIYACRQGVLRCLPGDYETPGDAKLIFEQHRGGTPWCLIGDVDPHTKRATFVLYSETAAGHRVQWKHVQKPLGGGRVAAGRKA